MKFKKINQEEPLPKKKVVIVYDEASKIDLEKLESLMEKYKPLFNKLIKDGNMFTGEL